MQIVLESGHPIVIGMIVATVVGAFVILLVPPLFASGFLARNVYRQVMPRGGNFLVPFGFSAIMLAPFVCFPADFGTSRRFCGNVLHIVSGSGYRLLLGISTARVYATSAVGKSVFFAPRIVTFFFAQVVIGKFAVFKRFPA